MDVGDAGEHQGAFLVVGFVELHTRSDRVYRGSLCDAGDDFHIGQLFGAKENSFVNSSAY